MANIPWKSPDPTEEALHAVQEALNPNQVESHTAQPATPAGPGEHAPQQETIDLFKAPAEPETWDAESPPQRAANDDRANIGQMLKAVHGRPARLPYIVASLAALAWAGGGLATAYLYGGELQTLFASPRVGIAALTVIVVAVLLMRKRRQGRKYS